MAVQPSQLKTPAGKIDPTFFPGEATAVLDARLQTYITEGEARVGTELTGVEKDDAVTLWVYYRAYEAVHLRLISTPAMVGIVGEGNTMFTQAQIDAFGNLAADYKSRFEAMIVVENLVTQRIPSGGVPTSYRF